MFQHTKLDHKFVHYIPERLDSGIIYISMEFATAAHCCCCGCGEQVITPFTPNDWKLTFDGETVSLRPSIGNWNFRCRSHYFIRNSRILAAGPWDEGQTENVGGQNRKQTYSVETKELGVPSSIINQHPESENFSFWKFFKQKLRKRRS